jgi:hypothetical protein
MFDQALTKLLSDALDSIGLCPPPGITPWTYEVRLLFVEIAKAMDGLGNTEKAAELRSIISRRDKEEGYRPN